MFWEPISECSSIAITSVAYLIHLIYAFMIIFTVMFSCGAWNLLLEIILQTNDVLD
jgi:hypothetical protein